ncbi:MAG TPA: hypothetical protein DC048_14920 [Planctomycetaceae bacterium]|nr:hypothetical protein [Planctomycetaceae bacterium]
MDAPSRPSSRGTEGTAPLRGLAWCLPMAASLLVGCGSVGPTETPPSRPAATATDESAPVPAPSPSVARPSPGAGPAEITFDDIKLDLAKGAPFRREVLTDRVTGLDGRRVRIRGYILPSFQQSGLTQFVLVRDNQECCFGPGAALHDCIVVRMQPGRTADFSIRPVAVAGTFRVAELRGPDGNHLAIYALEGENVQ